MSKLPREQNIQLRWKDVVYEGTLRLSQVVPSLSRGGCLKAEMEITVPDENPWTVSTSIITEHDFDEASAIIAVTAAVIEHLQTSFNYVANPAS